MPPKLFWSEPRDAQLRRMRAEGSTWRDIATELGISRHAAIERGRRIGAPRPPAEQVAPPPDPHRMPLPPGHPHSWGALIAGTLLEDTPYPHPGVAARAGTGATIAPAAPARSAVLLSPPVV